MVLPWQNENRVGHSETEHPALACQAHTESKNSWLMI